MKNLESVYLFVCIIPFLLVAGCGSLPFPSTPQNQPMTNTHNLEKLSTPLGGVSMDVSVTPPNPLADSAFTVTAKVENNGGSDATEVEVRLDRISGDFSISPEGWQKIGTLMKPVNGRESFTEVPWTVTAKERGGELEATLRYKYTTHAEGDIVVYNMKYATSSDKILQEAQSSPGILSFKGDAAPVTISLYDNGPIYYRGEKEDSIVFYVKNSGNGLVYDPVVGNKIRHVRVTIKIGNTYCLKDQDVQLNFVGETPIKCSFVPATQTRESIPFSITVSYIYEESSKVNVELKQI